MKRLLVMFLAAGVLAGCGQPADGAAPADSEPPATQATVGVLKDRPCPSIEEFQDLAAGRRVPSPSDVPDVDAELVPAGRVEAVLICNGTVPDVPPDADASPVVGRGYATRPGPNSPPPGDESLDLDSWILNYETGVQSLEGPNRMGMPAPTHNVSLRTFLYASGKELQVLEWDPETVFTMDRSPTSEIGRNYTNGSVYCVTDGDNPPLYRTCSGDPDVLHS